MEEKRISPLKAIRHKCLDCCCGSSNEVKLCPVTNCALYPFRGGQNPYRTKRKYTPEQKAALIARMGKANPQIQGGKTATQTPEGAYISQSENGEDARHNREE